MFTSTFVLLVALITPSLALPKPAPTAIPRAAHVPAEHLEAREQSVAATLTYASIDPSPTANRPMNPSISTDLINQVKGATTTDDRFQALYEAGSEYWKFDFHPNANPAGGVAQGRGGEGVLAQRNNFPMVYGTGVAMSMGFMNPCGMNTAAEFLNIITNMENPVRTGFVLENSFKMEFHANLTQFQAVLLPMGAIHFEQNDNCEPAIFVSAFSNDDPGLSSVANNFFSLDSDIVNSTLGFPREINAMNVAAFAPTIPPSFAIAVSSCLDRCGIPY